MLLRGVGINFQWEESLVFNCKKQKKSLQTKITLLFYYIILQ